MVEKNQADRTGKATESKFYLPAGVYPSSKASRIERIWAALFSHRI
jgi:hypothetical protein